MLTISFFEHRLLAQESDLQQAEQELEQSLGSEEDFAGDLPDMKIYESPAKSTNSPLSDHPDSKEKVFNTDNTEPIPSDVILPAPDPLITSEALDDEIAYPLSDEEKKYYEHIPPNADTSVQLNAPSSSNYLRSQQFEDTAPEYESTDLALETDAISEISLEGVQSASYSPIHAAPVDINCYFGDELRSYLSPLLACMSVSRRYLSNYFLPTALPYLKLQDRRFDTYKSRATGLPRMVHACYPLVLLLVMLGVIILLKASFRLQVTTIFRSVGRLSFLSKKDICSMPSNLMLYVLLTLVLSLVYGFTINYMLFSFGFSHTHASLLTLFRLSAIIWLLFLMRLLILRVICTFFENPKLYDGCFCILMNVTVISIILFTPIWFLMVLSLGWTNIFLMKIFGYSIMIGTILTYMAVAVYYVGTKRGSIMNLFLYICIFEFMPVILVAKAILLNIDKL